MAADLIESNGNLIHLGAPITNNVWGITVLDRDGKTLPLAFSVDQAREIARRIEAWLGEK